MQAFKKFVQQKPSTAKTVEVFVLYHCALLLLQMLLCFPAEYRIIPERIVSLVPSQTELLYYLGLEAAVAGITSFCIHPPHLQKSTVVIGGTKMLDSEKIKQLQPDLIIANKEENTKLQIEELAAYFDVWVTDVTCFADALNMIEDIGLLTKTENKAKLLIKDITDGFSKIMPAVKNTNTCYLIWRKPYMTAGGDTFINSMLQQCGLINIYADEKRYPEVNANDLRKKGCQLLLLSSEPYPFKQKHIIELQLQLPGIKIILANGEMFSWYGSRMLYSAAYFSKFIDHINLL